jgi:hypothetical protein
MVLVVRNDLPFVGADYVAFPFTLERRSGLLSAALLQDVTLLI